MVYEFKDVCDAWTVNSQVYMRLRFGRGPEVESVRTMATWESKDGASYRFHIKETQGGRPGPEIKGVAALDEATDAYLGFRKDVGDKLKAAFGADPDMVMAHVVRGYFMNLMGNRALVPRAEKSAADAEARAETIRRVQQGEADAVRLEKQAEADGLKAVKQAEADGLLFKLSAEADGTEQILTKKAKGFTEGVPATLNAELGGWDCSRQPLATI